MRKTITYRDFWDVPRMFLVRFQGELFLFDCPFDNTTEDFTPHYRVYRMPELSEDELAGYWAGLSERATAFVDEIAIERVSFDPTRRASIDATVFETLLAPAARP